MAEVKWIKITTNMFDDEKIDFIESLPDADAILVIWIKLLTLAGKCNAQGYIFLTENIPYSDEMLAHKFRRPINTVRLALKTFQELQMIEMDNHSMIYISNWEKHQNIDGLEKIREQNRIRKQHQRERQKLLSTTESHVTGHGTITQSHATDIDIEEEKENNMPFSSSPIPYKEIIDYLNEKVGSKYKSSSNKTKELIKARLNDGFSIDDFKQVIDVKTAEWLNTDQAKYLRPETLFGSKFEGYLNQKSVFASKFKPIDEFDEYERRRNADLMRYADAN